jgi:hypothetical protein
MYHHLLLHEATVAAGLTIASAFNSWQHCMVNLHNHDFSPYDGEVSSSQIVGGRLEAISTLHLGNCCLSYQISCLVLRTQQVHPTKPIYSILIIIIIIIM